jgi:hypothetical protein
MARISRILIVPRAKQNRYNETNYWRTQALKRKSSGWTVERRARQSALIRTRKPWEQSTGARTDEGKARSSQNALTLGMYTADKLARWASFRALLKAQLKGLKSIR